MALDWYYADAKNQQQGPVAAATLASAYRNGTVNAATLVWREGLAAWLPLQQVAAQLGLIVVGAAPALQAGPGRAAVAKPKSSGSLALVVIVVGFGFVAVLGILAAIAIPAYQDYLARARVGEALIQARALKVNVDEFFETENRCPKNGEGGIRAAADYASPTIASLQVNALSDGRCRIKVELSGSVMRVFDGKEVHLTRDGKGAWTHGSDLAPKYLPPSMR